MKYFVLKPSGKSEYASASRQAMVTFAEAIRSTDKGLHDSLLKWVDNESDKLNPPAEEIHRTLER